MEELEETRLPYMLSDLDVLLLRSLEVLVVLGVFLHGILLCRGLGEIDLLATRAAATGDDVRGVNFGEVVLLGYFLSALEALRWWRGELAGWSCCHCVPSSMLSYARQLVSYLNLELSCSGAGAYGCLVSHLLVGRLVLLRLGLGGLSLALVHGDVLAGVLGGSLLIGDGARHCVLV